MRRGLSFVLVLLLVLRGLLGDAMAVSAAPVAAPTAAVHHHAPTTSEHGTANPDVSSHGEDHAVPAGHDSIDAAAAACSEQDADCSHEHGPACSACGVCHSALFAPDLVAQPLRPQSLAQPSLGSAQFASASAAPDFKPPIS